MLQLLVGGGGGNEETFTVAVAGEHRVSILFRTWGLQISLGQWKGFVTQLSSALLSVCLLWSRGRWVSHPVAPLQTHCALPVRSERSVSHARRPVPVEILRSANGHDGIGICERRKNPNPNPPREIAPVSVEPTESAVLACAQ